MSARVNFETQGKIELRAEDGERYGLFESATDAATAATAAALNEPHKRFYLVSPDIMVHLVPAEPPVEPPIEPPVEPPVEPPDATLYKACREAVDFGAQEQYERWFHARDLTQQGSWQYDAPQGVIELALRQENTDLLSRGLDLASVYVDGFRGGPYGLNWAGHNVLEKAVRNGDSKFTHASSVYYLDKYRDQFFSDDFLIDLRDGLYRIGWYGQDWDKPFNPWSHWNERAAGYSLMGLHYLGEMDVPGTPAMIAHIVDWLADAQDPTTGAWLHSYYGHEGAGAGESIGDTTDVLCYSPWMVCIIAGALHRIRNSELYGGPAKIDGMLHKLAKGQLEYGLARADEGEWGYGGNESAYKCRYFSVPGDEKRQRQIQLNNGWNSDLHNPEMYLCLAAGGVQPPYAINDYYTERTLNEKRTVRRWTWETSSFG